MTRLASYARAYWTHILRPQLLVAVGFWAGCLFTGLMFGLGRLA